MPEASDNGSQPYSRAYRYGEMAGMGLPPNNIACPWVGDMCSPCPLPKGKVPGVWCRFPAISKNLKAFLYGWLPLSNAYGISSGCNKIHNIIPNGIPSVVSQSPNLTAECAPERGNEPLAQGTALGNLKQHKMIRPDRAKAPHTIQHPRRRLGLYDCWSFRPPLYGRVFIDWLL